MSLGLGWSILSRVLGKCKGSVAHLRSTHFTVQKFCACPVVCFPCTCVSHTQHSSTFWDPREGLLEASGPPSWGGFCLQEGRFPLESRKRVEITPLVSLEKSQILRATHTQIPQSQPHRGDSARKRTGLQGRKSVI